MKLRLIAEGKERAQAIMADLRLGTMTNADIARKHGVTKVNVGNLAKKYGIPTYKKPLLPPKPPPKSREEMNAAVTASNQKLWAEPEYRAKQLASRNTPEYTANKSHRQTEIWRQRRQGGGQTE